jgi:hypothetical protein
MHLYIISMRRVEVLEDMRAKVVVDVCMRYF